MATLRDTRQTAEHYQTCLTKHGEEVQLSRGFLLDAVQAERAASAANIRPALSAATSRLAARYALGTRLDELVPEVRALGALWGELYGAVGDRWQDRTWARALSPMTKNADLAITAVHSMSWAVSLGEREVVEQVLGAHSVQQANLPVIGHLARLAGVDADVDGKVAHPKLWQPWMDVVVADADTRVAAFEQFVTGYPVGLKGVRRLVSPTDPGYSGQFAFEAAPLAIFLDIDDTPVRDVVDYPADLVDFGRSLR